MTGEEYLIQHGIDPEFAKKEFKVNWDEAVLKFPIEDIEGEELWVKERNLKFDPTIKDGEPKFKNHGAQTVYNTQRNRTASALFFFEGEPDVWKATQDGIPTVCCTSGAATLPPPEYINWLNTKKLYICFDNDQPGQDGVAKLKAIFPMAFIIILPDGIKDYCEYRQQHSVADFQQLVKTQRSEQTATFTDICTVIDKWLLLPDKNVIKILLAIIISHTFPTDPIWIFLVAPPSGTKTELISAISTLPKVFALSDLTPQTLASGLNYRVDPSLLARLKDNILVMKDFTTVLSMRYEERQTILAQLREIYDGKYHKEFGSGKTVDWTGKITLIAGVTPIIDTQLSIFQVMGERFLMYRIPQATDTAIAQKALKNYGKERQMREELVAVMIKFFKGVSLIPIEEVTLPEDILQALSALASFVVILRSAVLRNNYTKDIEFIPTPESPARFVKTIAFIITSLAILDGRRAITWEDYYLGMRIAFDGVSRNIMSHFASLCKHAGEAEVKTSQIIVDTGYSPAGAEIILGDLVALKLVNVSGEGMGTTKFWSLADKTKKYLQDILPHNSKMLFQYFPEDDIYYPIIRMIFDEKEENSRENFVDGLKKEKIEK